MIKIAFGKKKGGDGKMGKRRCKAITKLSKKRCKSHATIGDYCITHYRMIREKR